MKRKRLFRFRNTGADYSHLNQGNEGVVDKWTVLGRNLLSAAHTEGF